jgi:SPP1 gp7 family putative phage head morphogenesis protein
VKKRTGLAALGDMMRSAIQTVTPQIAPGSGVIPINMEEFNDQPQAWPGLPTVYFQSPWAGDPYEATYPGAAATIAPIWACIDKLSNDIPAIPMKWTQKHRAKSGKTERVEADPDHWVPKLFRYGNQSYSGTEVLRDIVAGVLTLGNGLMWTDTDTTSAGTEGVPEQIWAVQLHMTKPIPGPYRSIRGWFWYPNVTYIPGERMIAFRNWNPNYNPMYPSPLGLSPLSAVRAAFESYGSAGVWQKKLFEKGLQVAGLFTLDQDTAQGLSEKEIKGIQKRMQRVGQGVQNAYDTIVEPGIKQVRPPIPPRDLQFVEQMAWNEHAIFMVYGIPPVIMGVKEGGGLSDAGATTDLLMYALGACSRQTNLLKAVINHQFCRKWAPDIELDFDLSGLPGVADSRLKQAEALVKIAGRPTMTLNQARAADGQDPAVDPNADEYMVPFNVLRSADMANDIRVQPDTPAEPGAGEDKSQRASRSRLSGAQGGARRAALRRMRDADLRRYERRVRMWARNRFRKQEQEVVARLEAHHPDALLAKRARFDYGDEYFPEDDDSKEAQEIYERIIAERGVEAGAEVGAEIALEVQRGKIADLIAQRASEMVGRIDATTKQRLTEAIIESVRENFTFDQLVRAVKEVFSGRRDNADTIARTETAWAYNTASFEAWKAAGVQYKSWLTAHDNAVRDSHTLCEGEENIDINAMFSNACMYPGDPNGLAEEVINCRCTLQPQFTETSDTGAGDITGDDEDESDQGGSLRRRSRTNGHVNASRWPAWFKIGAGK